MVNTICGIKIWTNTESHIELQADGIFDFWIKMCMFGRELYVGQFLSFSVAYVIGHYPSAVLPANIEIIGRVYQDCFYRETV